MQLKAITLLAVAIALPTALGEAQCDSSIDTSVGSSCSEVGNIACAETNTAVVSKAFVLTRRLECTHLRLLTILPGGV